MPGCSLDPRQIGAGSDDFCHKPATSNTLVIMADRELELRMEKYPLDRCQGDCWDDEDCLGDLVCVYFDDDRKNVQDCVGWAEVRMTWGCSEAPKLGIGRGEMMGTAVPGKCISSPKIQFLPNRRPKLTIQYPRE